MDDQDIEKLLNRYAPAGPPPELRARIVRPARPVRLWPWAVAASVLLVATIGLRVRTVRVAATVGIVFGPDPSRVAVEDLTDLLGGDDVARRYAEAVLARADDQTSRAASATAFGNDESELR